MDIDVIYHDPRYTCSEREIEMQLAGVITGLNWDVKNQDGIHLWFKNVFGYDIKPLQSSEDSIKMWNSSSIGIRLLHNGKINYGLSDLFEMKYR